MKQFIVKSLRRIGAVMQPSGLTDLRLEMARQATASSARYILSNMPQVQSVGSMTAVHDAALERVSLKDGLTLEFGVFSGNSINYIAARLPGIVDGFDSFEGLPESWRDGFGEGHFQRSDLPALRNNVRLHKGWFNESIPVYLENLENKFAPIAYLHVDCDLYSSTKTIFELLGDRIIPGTVIVFDEYFNYAGWEQGEYLAFQELVRVRCLNYSYITYNHSHEQVAVVINQPSAQE